MKPLQIQIEGVGVWAPGGAGTEHAIPPPRPPALSLSAQERRRAPEGVLLAVEAADQAIRMSGREAATLLSVFNSCRGDQTITDYMCRTLAEDPFSLSPTRFHNSVHNAAAGYWGIAHTAMGSSTAVSTEPGVPGQSLLEAMALCICEEQPVLWVSTETRGSGPLRELSGYAEGMACALVLAPREPGSARPWLEARLQPGPSDARPAHGHPVAGLLPWLSGLEQGGSHQLPVCAGQVLQLRVHAGSLQ